jgi:LysR family glycine cleavage system transcriptional activator
LSSPPRKLPPLRSLRVFEAAARHQNYTRAASELALTHGAVSHQIQLLQSQLGLRLFERDGRRMRLTDDGRTLAAAVRSALDHLGATIDSLSARHMGKGLTVSVLPSFAAAWLVERLGSFMSEHPDIEFNLQSSRNLADFDRDGVDVAIRYGEGPWPNLMCERILEEEVFPVCSPQFNGGKLPQSARELLELPLLRLKSNEWEHWFSHTGIDAPIRGPLFDDTELSLLAASRGQGVALARSSLIAQKLRDGVLIEPFLQRVAARSAYYLVYPQAHADRLPVRQFREWLIRQIAADPTLTPRPIS